jgi:hypothetical protein
VFLNGTKAYGVFIAPGMGYRNNKPSGTATGDASEGIYAIFDGTHYNSGCCFDYGNAETSSKDTGAGHMEAIYFGTEAFWGSGAGKGPWIMADVGHSILPVFIFLKFVLLFVARERSILRPRCQTKHRRPIHHLAIRHRHRQRCFWQSLGNQRW